MTRPVPPRPGDACDPRFLDLVRQEYLSAQRPTLAACWRRACKAAEGTDIPIASYATVRRLMYTTTHQPGPRRHAGAP